MSRNRKLAVLGLFLVALLAGGPAMRHADAGVFNPETFTLDNGLQVVVVKNHRVPVITMIMYYKVGAMDEPPGKSGLAHYLEHLMFKGTQNLAPGEFSSIVASNGGRDNAFTSQDYTGYVSSFASDRLDLMLGLEAERMTGLRLTPEEIEPERRVVLEERLSRIENDPAAQLGEQAAAALYANHPYRIPIIGWAHEIEALTRDDIIDFYRAWYAPNNAILVISGDVTMDQVRPMVAKHFAAIQARDLPPRPDWREPPRSAERTVTLEHPRVRQPAWSRRFLAPSYVHGEKRHAYALEVLNEILGGGTSGRLYRALVIEQGVATSAGAWYNSDTRGPATFGFYASPRPGKTLEQAVGAAEAEIARVLSNGVTEDEVREAIARLQAQAVYARDSLSTPARVLGGALVIGQRVEDIEAWPERIGKVTAAQVNAAAKAVLGGAGPVTTYLKPVAKSIAGPAEKSG